MVLQFLWLLFFYSRERHGFKACSSIWFLCFAGAPSLLILFQKVRAQNSTSEKIASIPADHVDVVLVTPQSSTDKLFSDHSDTITGGMLFAKDLSTLASADAHVAQLDGPTPVANVQAREEIVPVAQTEAAETPGEGNKVVLETGKGQDGSLLSFLGSLGGRDAEDSKADSGGFFGFEFPRSETVLETKSAEKEEMATGSTGVLGFLQVGSLFNFDANSKTNSKDSTQGLLSRFSSGEESATTAQAKKEVSLAF